MMIRTATLVVPRHGAGQDRAAVVEIPGGVVAVLADGAGGTAGGELAAQAVVDAVTARAASAPDWVAVLEDLDRPARHGGQTTAIAVEVTAAGIRGASVGDSRAVVVAATTNTDDLTRFQQRKPLLGSGEAIVTALGAGPLTGRVLVASDGLWKYARARDIEAAVRDTADLAAVPARLVGLVRMPPDDISIIVAEWANVSP
jgi:serine/threonine protein phosphatase PrpC